MFRKFIAFLCDSDWRGNLSFFADVFTILGVSVFGSVSLLSLLKPELISPLSVGVVFIKVLHIVLFFFVVSAIASLYWVLLLFVNYYILRIMDSRFSFLVKRFSIKERSISLNFLTHLLLPLIFLIGFVLTILRALESGYFYL